MFTNTHTLSNGRTVCINTAPGTEHATVAFEGSVFMFNGKRGTFRPDTLPQKMAQELKAILSPTTKTTSFLDVMREIENVTQSGESNDYIVKLIHRMAWQSLDATNTELHTHQYVVKSPNNTPIDLTNAMREIEHACRSTTKVALIPGVVNFIARKAIAANGAQ
jgi:hypothetical protein